MFYISAHSAKAPLHPWEWPAQPWSCLHLDFVGPFLGHMYLVLVDAHSKWLDVQIMQSTTSENYQKTAGYLCYTWVTPEDRYR